MILLFRETLFLMIFLNFSVTSFSIYFFRQKDAKMDPKRDQNGITNHKKTRFLRFLVVLEEDVFSRFLETKKIGPKSGKNPEKNQRGSTGTTKIARPGGMRGASGEVRTSPGSSDSVQEFQS